MPNRKIPMIGRTFASFLVTELDHESNGRSYYRCVCNVCGSEVVKEAGKLRKAKRICGCKNYDAWHKNGEKHIGNMDRKHGSSRTKLYQCWSNMKNRCYNPNVDRYSQYGGRGITVCDEWVHDFPAFKKWAYENGYREGLTIDRIDVNGNYEPSNCRWATVKEQFENIQKNVNLTVDGVTHTAAEWTRIVGCSKNTILERHKKGWTDRECVYGKER